MDSPVTPSRTTDTVRPAQVLVLPHTYRPRGAAADTACGKERGQAHRCKHVQHTVPWSDFQLADMDCMPMLAC